MRIDISNQKFGRLTAIRPCKNDKGKSAWVCICECGENIITYSCNLRTGQTRSCGCLRKEVAASIFKHKANCRGKRTSEYRTWSHIKTRCFNIKSPRYSDYGGRGITMCEAWRESFTEFLKDVGLKPSPHHSLDRINNDGHYELGNVEWRTCEEQNNNRRDNVIVEYKGNKMTLANACRKLGVKYTLAGSYIRKYGWTFEKIISFIEAKSVAMGSME